MVISLGKRRRRSLIMVNFYNNFFKSCSSFMDLIDSVQTLLALHLFTMSIIY